MSPGMGSMQLSLQPGGQLCPGWWSRWQQQVMVRRVVSRKCECCRTVPVPVCVCGATAGMGGPNYPGCCWVQLLPIPQVFTNVHVQVHHNKVIVEAGCVARTSGDPQSVYVGQWLVHIMPLLQLLDAASKWAFQCSPSQQIAGGFGQLQTLVCPLQDAGTGSVAWCMLVARAAGVGYVCACSDVVACAAACITL